MHMFEETLLIKGPPRATTTAHWQRCAGVLSFGGGRFGHLINYCYCYLKSSQKTLCPALLLHGRLFDELCCNFRSIAGVAPPLPRPLKTISLSISTVSTKNLMRCCYYYRVRANSFSNISKTFQNLSNVELPSSRNLKIHLHFEVPKNGKTLFVMLHFMIF